MSAKFVIQNLFLLITLPILSLNAVEVEVTITGLRSAKGKIVIGVFKDDPTFQKEEAYASMNFQKKDILNGTMKVTFSMEPGVWGLSVLDDENGSGLMEYNFIGIPKEGFGFSDYYHTGFTKPKFKDFKFSVEGGKNKKILVKIRYI
jgi:uncharacterized protein (DUF2141 family)